jgi:hypothetical protein
VGIPQADDGSRAMSQHCAMQRERHMHIAEINARLDLQSVALQEVLRALAPAQAAQVAAAINQRVGTFAGELTPREDVALAGELSALVGALRP